MVKTKHTCDYNPSSTLASEDAFEAASRDVAGKDMAEMHDINGEAFDAFRRGARFGRTHTLEEIAWEREQERREIAVREYRNGRREALECSPVSELYRTHQQMIILMNGSVPGKTAQQVFEEAMDARGAFEAAKGGGV